jgi:ring-1,2-phenylacetyl-CoA epoxidase subunit PaaC
MTAATHTDVLLAMADDELVLGWRDSEWTGIAPFLEEDVALSSIAQGEIGHARALYELAAAELGTTPDELAFDRTPDEYRCAPLVELRRIEWARTIARRFLYETADAIRVEALKRSERPGVAGLAQKMEREEAYHRMHAEMWIDRLRESDDGRRRLGEAVAELWPYALGVLEGEQRDELVRRAAARLDFLEPPEAEPVERGEHTDDLAPLWDEMTNVRRSVPGASW